MVNVISTPVHAIQLSSIDTVELFIRVNDHAEKDNISSYKDEVEMASAHTDFDRQEKTINVGLRLSLGMDEDAEMPVSMRVEVVGRFSVDTDEFPENRINDWAVQNAPLILYPFIRENGVALTTRCGLPPLLLPLLQIPTLKDSSNKGKKSKKKKK